MPRAAGAAKSWTRWPPHTFCKARSISCAAYLIRHSPPNTRGDLLPLRIASIGSALPDHSSGSKQAITLVPRHDVEMNMRDALAHDIVLCDETSLGIHSTHDGCR